MRDSSGRFSKAPKRTKESDIADIFWMVQEMKKDLKQMSEDLAYWVNRQLQLEVKVDAARGEIGERLRVIEGDIEKMQKVIGVLARHSKVEVPVLRPRLIGINAMKPSEEQACDVCGELGHEHCVEAPYHV
jgi:hypothetical protein